MAYPAIGMQRTCTLDCCSVNLSERWCQWDPLFRIRMHVQWASNFASIVSTSADYSNQISSPMQLQVCISLIHRSGRGFWKVIEGQCSLGTVCFRYKSGTSKLWGKWGVATFPFYFGNQYLTCQLNFSVFTRFLWCRFANHSWWRIFSAALTFILLRSTTALITIIAEFLSAWTSVILFPLYNVSICQLDVIYAMRKTVWAMFLF